MLAAMTAQLVLCHNRRVAAHRPGLYRINLTGQEVHFLNAGSSLY